MSKIGNKIIKCSSPIEITILDTLADNNKLTFLIKGTLGEVKLNTTKEITDNLHFIKLYWTGPTSNVSQISIKFKNLKNGSDIKRIWGTFRALFNNAIVGVSQGFTSQLELVGLGYRAYTYKNRYLLLLLGLSHGIQYAISDDVNIICIKPTLISIFGLDKQRVNQVAAEIRQLRPPEAYKGKGIRLIGEQIRQKEGKRK